MLGQSWAIPWVDDPDSQGGGSVHSFGMSVSSPEGSTPRRSSIGVVESRVKIGNIATSAGGPSDNSNIPDIPNIPNIPNILDIPDIPK